MEISYLEQIVKKIVVPSVIIIIKRHKKRLYKRHVKMRPKVVLDNLKSFLERLYHIPVGNQKSTLNESVPNREI